MCSVLTGPIQPKDIAFPPFLKEVTAVGRVYLLLVDARPQGGSFRLPLAT
jgi:hypothetical protein